MPEFDEFNPEARYWAKQGITFLKMNANQFIDYVAQDFPIDSSEWTEKINLRIEHKYQIAGSALKELNRIIKNNKVNLILDSGTTTLIFAKLLMEEIKNDNLSLENISVITNSPPIINEFSDNLRYTESRRVPVEIIGGTFRYQTQAFAPNKELANKQLNEIDKKNKLTIAFIGATFINRNGLFTKTEEETNVKRKFIDIANKIYVLADHSKEKEDVSGFSFSGLSKKINIITDRKDSFLSIKGLVKRIITD